jgi:1,4-dihydroxy-2-naphthoate octaprenyltransferase
MMEWGVALVIAVATGLAFLAYKHPLGYKPLGQIIAGFLAGSTAIIGLLMLGIATGIEMVAENNPMIQNGHYRFYGWHPLAVILLLTAASAFAGFLLLIPKFKSDK